MNRLIDICSTEIRVYGKFVRTAKLEAEKYQFLDDPGPVIEQLRKCRERVDLFTFMPSLRDAERRYDFPVEQDNLAVLPVTTFGEWWNKQIGFKARNKAKQAEKKGVVVRETPFDDELVKGIWNVYNECPVRQGRRFPHYGKDLLTVHREEATFLSSSVFAGAYWEGNLIGFTKLVYDSTRTQAGLMNIVSLVAHRDKAPNNALIAQAVRSCAERGISFLVYSNFAYGEKQKSSISDFKERNGFKRVDLPRYYVPLTTLGSAVFKFGLHRRLADRVPEALASRLRGLRETWYSRRFQSMAEGI